MLEERTIVDIREEIALTALGGQVTVSEVARQFGVQTSGHTLVYGPDGSLLFSGGITGSRGHLGDNRSFAAVSRIITNHSIQLARTTAPVFGCELLNRCTRNQTANRN